jgi:nucleoside-diphosphate-sugar epimerase
MIDQSIFITGGSGYIGRTLIPALLTRGHRVRALIRATSRQRLPEGISIIEVPQIRQPAL